MSNDDHVLDALRKVYAKLLEIERKVGALSVTPSASGASRDVAPDADLDRADGRGDPEVRKDPKRWQGPPVAPARMSECPADYLDAVAELKEWQASQEDVKGTDEARKKAHFCRLDAARARGWAARRRATPEQAHDEAPEEL